ncbi:hypothetical protein AB0F18_26250 [Streptomyces sp. NPDC029216]|uniref:hypothetical protein n=1 Tax=Streptomyces sp. NPDC029216 TaxID=3154701 RepID=UPI0033FD5380
MYGTARPAMWLNLGFSVLLLVTVGHSWKTLAPVISAAMVISYLIGPVAVGVFRRTRPALPRPFRLPAAGVLCPLTFVFAVCALYWSKWPNTGVVTALTLPAAPAAALVLAREGHRDLGRQFAPAWWIVFFLGALSLLSFLGSAGFGGRGLLPGGVGIALVAAIALVTYHWAVRAGVRAHLAGLTGPDPVPEAPAEPARTPEGEPAHV